MVDRCGRVVMDFVILEFLDELVGVDLLACCRQKLSAYPLHLYKILRELLILPLLRL